MKSTILLLTLTTALLAQRGALAATYYVDCDIGDDDGEGDADDPWQTLQFAVDNINNGDTIIVRPGFCEGCRIGESGAPGAGRKTLRAEPGVTIDVPGPENRHESNIEVELFDSTVSHWIIEGFELTGAPRSGVDLRGTSDITVRYCYVHNNGRTGIFTAFSDDAVIEYNESAFNGEHGVYTSNSGDRPQIRGNLFHHNAAAGVHMNGDRRFRPGDGVITGATVEQNKIWENGTLGASAINCDGVSDSMFRNNLLYENHASGISLYAIDGSQGSSRNQVYNNTIVMAGGSRWVINIPRSRGGISDPVGNKIKNNILYTPRADRGSILIYRPTIAGFESDYNVVVNRFSTNGGSSIINLSSWQSLGYDRNSLIASPTNLFVDPDDPIEPDFHLRPGSMAIDRGTTVPVLIDLEGVPRPQGPRWDIGAYEFVSSQ
ncbi:right-handed parallel beta-helix repeat-containing protein [Sorangium sp. So ce302]|uniref:right-handed parallel beta-helix repeat-containing protein n=1 Tax=Sorangium sp. So ce302 TaxID=3133297 RepID=UPI003F5D8C7F